MVYDLQVVCPLTNDGKAWFFCSKKKKRLGCGFCTYEAQILHVRQRIGIEDVSDPDTSQIHIEYVIWCICFFFSNIGCMSPQICEGHTLKGKKIKIKNKKAHLIFPNPKLSNQFEKATNPTQN